MSTSKQPTNAPDHGDAHSAPSPSKLRALAPMLKRFAPILALFALVIVSVIGAAVLGKARKVVVAPVVEKKVEERVTLEQAFEALDGEYYGQAREFAAK